jgi:peptide/nickel transport system permease protein
VTALRRSSAALAGSVILVVLAGVAVLAYVGLLPYDPIAQNPPARFQPPSGAHLFGTDQFGRDVFSRVAAGVGNSALIAVVAVAFATVIGTLGGLVSGFYRGWADGAIGGVTRMKMGTYTMSLAAVLDRNWFTIAVAIAIVYVPIFIRVTRGPVLSLREIAYVKAAVATGLSRAQIMLRHVLPNITSIIVVQVALSLSWAVLTEASLSFLGLGTPPPAPSLGSMIFEARSLVFVAPWTLIAPGAVVVLLVVGLNLLGDGLRDTLDPRNRGRRS